MITFKKGQRVWWDDPVHEKSGEYDVHAVDYAQNIVKIGNGEETVELPSEQLEKTDCSLTNWNNIITCWEKTRWS